MKNIYHYINDAADTIAVDVERRDGEKYTFYVDADDLPILEQYATWRVLHQKRCPTRTWVCTGVENGSRKMRRYRGKMVLMKCYDTLILGRILLGLDLFDERVVSYRDGDPLNCRRSNLFISTLPEAVQCKTMTTTTNTGHRGISRNTTTGWFHVNIGIDREELYKCFSTLSAAISWRDQMLGEAGFKLIGNRRVRVAA